MLALLIAEGPAHSLLDAAEEVVAREVEDAGGAAPTAGRHGFEEFAEALHSYAGAHEAMVVAFDGAFLGLGEIAAAGDLTHADVLCGRATGVNLIDGLGIELVVVDFCLLADDAIHEHAEVAARACAVGQHLHGIASGDERSTARQNVKRGAIGCLQADVGALQVVLHDALLLGGGVAVELIDIDELEDGHGAQHLLLLRQVAALHIAVRERGRQQPTAEGALANTLRPHEDGHHLVGIVLVGIDPLAHHRTEPHMEPAGPQAVGGGDAACQSLDAVVAVPGAAQAPEVLIDGVRGRHARAVQQSIHESDVSPHASLLRLHEECVAVFLRHASPCPERVPFTEEQCTADDITFEVIAAEEHLLQRLHIVGHGVAHRGRRMAAGIMRSHLVTHTLAILIGEEAHHARPHLALLDIQLGGSLHDGIEISIRLLVGVALLLFEGLPHALHDVLEEAVVVGTVLHVGRHRQAQLALCGIARHRLWHVHLHVGVHDGGHRLRQVEHIGVVAHAHAILHLHLVHLRDDLRDDAAVQHTHLPVSQPDKGAQVIGRLDEVHIHGPHAHQHLHRHAAGAHEGHQRHRQRAHGAPYHLPLLLGIYVHDVEAHEPREIMVEILRVLQRQISQRPQHRHRLHPVAEIHTRRPYLRQLLPQHVQRLAVVARRTHVSTLERFTAAPAQHLCQLRHSHLLLHLAPLGIDALQRHHFLQDCPFHSRRQNDSRLYIIILALRYKGTKSF